MRRSAIHSFTHDAAKRGGQLRSGQTEFIVVMQRQLAEDSFSFCSECKQHFAAVVLGARTMDESSGFQAVHQFNSAVVADLHPVGQFANTRPHSGRHAFNRQHQLILAALQTGLLYDLLAEMKETPNLVAKLRQRLVVGQGELLHAADCIVPRSASTPSHYIVKRYKLKFSHSHN
jgi:hypothetical protein